MKLPPKPQGNPNNSHNINYKLPPRPMYPGMQSPNQGSNKSFDYDTSRQREKSKENLRNLGAQIVQGKDNINVNINLRPPSAASNNRIGRSNSQQKVVYPSWWGWFSFDQSERVISNWFCEKNQMNIFYEVIFLKMFHKIFKSFLNSSIN